MRKIRSLLIYLFVFLAVWVSIPVSAYDSFIANLSTNSTVVKNGDYVEVRFSFEANKDTNEEISAFQATLDYDEKLFEEVKQSDFEILNSWEEFLYNSNNKQFVVINKSGKLKEKDVLKLKLKVKNNISTTRTSIKFKDIIASNGSKDMYLNNSEVQLDITSQQKNNTGNTENKTSVGVGQNKTSPNGSTKNNTTNNSTANEKENNNVVADNKDTTKENTTTNIVENSEDGSEEGSEDSSEDGSEEALKDGSEGSTTYKNLKIKPTTLSKLVILEVILLIILILLVIIIRKKLSEKGGKLSLGGKLLFVVIVVIIILIQVFVVTKAVGHKGELNGDGEIDYKDVSILEQHLIDLNILPDNLLENADMNYDGNITVTDLSLLVRKIEKNLNYYVEITSSMDDYYPTKNEEINLKFSADVSYGATIEEVTINNENYKVEKLPDTNEYAIKFNTLDKAGVIEFKFTKVKLNVGKEVDVNFTEKIDILKDQPTIENYKINELASESKMKVSFDVKDTDSAFKSSIIEIVEKNGSKVIHEETVVVGQNEFTFNLEDKKDYIVNIYIDYDLDTNTLVEHEKDNSGSLVRSYDLKLNIDYKFEFNNLKAFNSKGEETSVFNKNEPIIIKFNSKNQTIYKPKSVKVNDVEYKLSENASLYEATLNGIGTIGENEIKVQEVLLENGNVFNLDKSNVIKLTINKDKPQVEDVVIQELEEKTALKIAFKIKDPEQSISKKKIVVKNDKDKIILDKEFEQLEFEETYELEEALTSKYKIEVKVDYDLTTDNSNLLKDQVIYTQTIDAKPRISIVKSEVSPNTIEKDGEVNITYTIESNQNIQIKQFVVNDIKAIATKQKDNIYMVKIPVGNKSGLKELKLTKAILENDTEVSINKIDSVEVLKDEPEVNDYEIVEDFDKDEVRVKFNINDLDKAFVSGKVQLVKEDKSTQSEEEIKGTGINNFNLSVKEGEKYTFKVILTYKKDEDGNNLIKEKVLLEKPIQMIRDYNLKISDIKTSNDKETQYFNRNEKIKISFTSTNSTILIPEKAQINGKEYKLNKLENNRYETTIDGFDAIGVSDITIEKVWMNSTKELIVDENNVVKVEVLKIAPTVESFTYEKTEEEQIKLTFNIKDEEEALKKGKLIVNDKNKEVFSTESLKVGENQFTFNRTLSEDYEVQILFDYDLDTNSLGKGQNEYTGQKVLEKTITISNELIELKDIQSVKLYKKNGDNVEEVKSVDTNNFNPSEYLAKVIMKNIPNLYSEIKLGKVVGNEFRLVLNYDNAIQYEGAEKRNEIEVKFGEVDKGNATVIEFDELIKRIQENPTVTINLTNDLDAASISVNTETYLENFKGVINGNGHTIKNLSKPLFNQLQNAKVENLIIKNAKLSGSSRGVLSNSAIGSTITNVHITDSSIDTWNNIGTGGFIGTAEDNTVISKSSLNNIFVRSNKFVGGFVGFLNTNSIIENSYIKGTVTAGWDAVGGMVGQTHGLTTIQNSYADVTLNVSVTVAGGLVGFSNGNNVILKNNISLATGGDKATRIIATNYNNQSDNNYELQESTLKSNVNGTKIKVVSKKDINETFLKTQLNWDNEVWSLTGASGDKMPALNNLDPNNTSLIVKPKNNEVNIPNFERISKLAEYDSKMEIAYHNMHVLMPFYDSKYYISYGNQIDESDILNTQKINSIIAYNKDSKMISGLNSDNYNSISKIKVIFENNQIKEYNLAFKKRLNDVATYKIDSLGIGYTYNKFILNKNISLVNEIINKAKSMDYSKDISTVTAEAESRLYVDYYNESVKSKINDIIIGILQNEDDYNLYLDNEILKKKVSNELFTDKQLEKLIYTYNYYEKWYKIDIGGIRISDLLYFNSENLINKEYDIKRLTQNAMSIKQEYRNTAETVNYYNNGINPITNKTLKEFLEYYMRIEGFNDPNEWFSKSFKGIISEKPLVGKEGEVDYRAWTLLNKRDNHLLPILTAPQQDMYIITVPTQIFIGSLNRYNEHLNKNTEGMKNLVENYAIRLSNFYTTSSSFINNSVKILNSKTHIQYDTRFGFPNTGNQDNGSTQDSVIKWVYEAVGKFAAANGSGAYANGTDVYWVAYNILGGDFNFEVFAHETAHNQDGYYFYEGKGRRNGTGAEDHADANIAQSLNDGSFVFNIRNDFNIEADISNNLTLGRITGKENIGSYYKEMFETYYVLDYLTAKAFLELTPEQQSKVATQANYVNDDNPEDGGLSTEYKALTAEEIKNMKLEDIEDLWNNRIVFRGPGTISGNPPGSYGGDNHYNIYWYQPHNDNGRPDSYSFKRLGFEMLGVGGYTNGYVAYRSGMRNDLDALRIATDDSTITWKEYKMQRFENVENNLSKIKYFNSDKVIELYKQALTKDAAVGNRNETNNVRRVLYGMVKRATNDFSNATIYNNNNIIEVSTAEELVEKVTNNRVGNYKLKGNLDFSKIDVSQRDAYINVTFLGTLDGNGFKITGLTKPLLNKVTYANVKNIIVDSPVYLQNETAALIKTAKNSMIEDITINDSNISVPIVGATQGSLQKSGKIEATVKSNEIKSIEDLIKINNDPTGFSRKMKYKLVKDLDFSSQNLTTPVITGEFLGAIEGDGHTISNLKVPLFENLKGNVSNLNLNNVILGNTGADMIGAIAKVATNAVISNIKIDNITATAHYRVGSIVGVSTNTEYKKISVTNAKIKSTGYYGGVLIGRSQGSTTIQDVAVSGTLTISDTTNGGLIGAVKNGDTINRAFVDVNVTQDNEKDVKNGGLYGAFEGNGSIKVSNVIVVGDVSNKVYKITPETNDNEKNQITNYLSNVYEKQESTGISNSEINKVIKVAKEENLKDETFYTNILSWPTEVWNFSDLESGPKIK